MPAGKQAGLVRAVAIAQDRMGRGVAAAVAVAGVPTIDGEDNEEEMEGEDDFRVHIEVEVFTDPADAMKDIIIQSVAGTGTDNQPPTDSMLMAMAQEQAAGELEREAEAEAEAEAEVEAEAGYAAAAAASSASAAGPYAISETKAWTRTDKLQGAKMFTFVNTGMLQLIEAGKVGEEVTLVWEGPGEHDYLVEYLDATGYREVGRVEGANPGIDDNFTLRVKEDFGSTQLHNFRISVVDQPELNVDAQVTETDLGISEFDFPYPNPTEGRTTATVTFEQAQQVRAFIVESATGRRVESIYNARVNAGEPVQLLWEPEGQVPAGTYLLMVEGEHASASRPVVLTR